MITKKDISGALFVDNINPSVLNAMQNMQRRLYATIGDDDA